MNNNTLTAKQAKTGAAIYCRVSTKEQVTNNSLTRQDAECRNYCRVHGLTVLALFKDEGESAKTDDRPELQRLLAYCAKERKRVATVVVMAIDRFSRNSVDYHALKATLKTSGVTIKSATENLTDSPESNFMENVLAARAQLENDLKSAGTKSNMKAVLNRGKWTFQVPLGYRQESGTIVHDEQTAPLLAEAFALMATGGFGRRDVLKRLTRKGLRTRRGNPICGQMFARILRNPFYAGWSSSLGGTSASREHSSP